MNTDSQTDTGSPLQNSETLSSITRVIDRLLGPGGCPWDQEQTPVSLCDYLIEECYELVEALRSGSKQDIEEEMGDVFFLLLFLVRLLKQDGVTTMTSIAEKNAVKMISRHPHVFSDTEINSREELLRNWERIKKGEKSEKKGVFASLPVTLPPLLRAYRIHSKASRTGFTWVSDADFETHFEKEKQEWEQARKSGNQDAMLDEFGDFLFCVVEMGRRCGIKANAALHKANAKFLRRFSAMEELAAAQGQDFSELDCAQKNALWERVKEEERQ